MNLATLPGTLAFTSLEFWSPDAASEAFTTPGNRFVATAGDEGTVTGVFTERQHEGMGGTVSRADLSAAFGRTR